MNLCSVNTAIEINCSTRSTLHTDAVVCRLPIHVALTKVQRFYWAERDQCSVDSILMVLYCSDGVGKFYHSWRCCRLLQVPSGVYSLCKVLQKEVSSLQISWFVELFDRYIRVSWLWIVNENRFSNSHRNVWLCMLDYVSMCGMFCIITSVYPISLRCVYLSDCLLLMANECECCTEVAFILHS